MPSLADRYYAAAIALLQRAREQNAPVLRQLGAVIGESVARGGVVHTFGSGHSEVIDRKSVV